MPAVPPSRFPAPEPRAGEQSSILDGPILSEPEESQEAGYSPERLPLSSEEMSLLLAFFELLQAWDEDQKIV
jgi:hypothetical protein